MIAFNDEWQAPPQMTDEMAKKFIMSVFQAQMPPPAPSSTQALHIAEYIEYMMSEGQYTSLNITVDKDPGGTLVFTINKKEK